MATAYAQEQNKHRLERFRAQERKEKGIAGKVKNVSSVADKALHGGKLDNVDTIALVIFALLVDGSQFLIALLDVIGIGTIINVFVTIIVTMTVAGGLYFFKHLPLKSLYPLFGGSAVEIIPIPFLSALPAFTAVIIAIIIRDRFGSLKSFASSIKGTR